MIVSCMNMKIMCLALRKYVRGIFWYVLRTSPGHPKSCHDPFPHLFLDPQMLMILQLCLCILASPCFLIWEDKFQTTTETESRFDAGKAPKKNSVCCLQSLRQWQHQPSILVKIDGIEFFRLSCRSLGTTIGNWFCPKTAILIKFNTKGIQSDIRGHKMMM